MERNALEEVKKLATIHASEIIYQRDMDTLREDHERSLRNQRLDMETYLYFMGQTAQQWEEQLRPQAEDRLATVLVLRKLAEQEELEVGPDEIDAEIDRLMENSADESAASLRGMLNQEDSRESLRSSLLNRKVMAFLVEIATGEAGEEAGDAGEVEEAAEEPSAESAPEAEPEDDAGETPAEGEPSNG